MINFIKLSENYREFLAMTGYSVMEFNALLHFFEESVSESRMTVEGKERERKPAVYKNSVFSCIADQLLFILVYMKQYMTQTALGQLFGISQPKSNLWIHYLMPILSDALHGADAVPCRDMKDLHEDEADIYIHDGTERRIQRPKDNEIQKMHYSGKTKTHTVKNNVIANAKCVIIFLSLTAEGKKHDKKIADETGYILPDGSTLLQDTGFQGFSVKNVAILQPVKKPGGKELTGGQKEMNRKISKIRIRIEHVVSGVKRYRIVKDRLRNWLRGFADTVMETACALHNFRLRFRPWQEVKLQEV